MSFKIFVNEPIEAAFFKRSSVKVVSGFCYCFAKLKYEVKTGKFP